MKVFRMIAFYVGVTFMSSQTSVLAKRKENFSGPEQVTFNEESTAPDWCQRRGLLNSEEEA